MRPEWYQVVTYEPLQVAPCVGSGLRAIFKGSAGEPDHVSPVAAMVVCRVRYNWFFDGKMVQRGSVERAICGVTTYSTEGFGLCEETSNFLGYLQPGEPQE